MKGFDPKAYAEKHPELAARAGIGAEGRRSKYGSTKTLYNGVLYDSKLESTCAAQLDALIKLGYVLRWDRQVRFQLTQGVVYVADFRVTYRFGGPRIMDAKGVETDVFKVKRKLFEERYGPLDVVKRWQEIPLEGR